MPLILKGVMQSTVTPLKEDFSPDLATFERLLDFHVRTGATAISWPHHKGESLNLTIAERKAFAEVAVKVVAGRIPVSIHVSALAVEDSMELVILLVVVGAIALFVVAIYNSLVQKRNRIEEALGQIQVQLKRRHDLIPNLVETVKGYMKHEQQTLENVTKARNLAQQAQGRAGQIAAEGALGAALANLFAVVENYPDLKANQNFLSLQEEITSTESRIAFSRQFYNDSVMEYNNVRQTFPTVTVATLFNFSEEPYWKLGSAEERSAPKVSFQS